MFKTQTTYRTTPGVDTAQAFITKGRQRIKQFGSIVYLNDNDTFEIELFNPNQKRVLAKIKLNGSYISGGGIVLRPGERVFLERFLDENKKFVFSTYKVNGNSKEVQEAIALNGLIEIEFFSEYTPTVSSYIYTTNSNGIITTGSPVYNPFTTTANVSNATFTSNINSNISANAFYSNNNLQQSDVVADSVGTLSLTSFNASDNVRSKKTLSKEVETGRVEKGQHSSQQMAYVDGNFWYYAFTTITWQIKPTSQKPYTASEIAQRYCGECGAKIKKDSFKFCPQCGTKLG
jgi:zinc-ribbon domain